LERGENKLEPGARLREHVLLRFYLAIMGNNKSSIELPLRDAYPFAKFYGLGYESDKIQGIRTPDGVHESVYRRALMSQLLTAHDLLREFAREFWPHGSTPEGRNLLSRYQRVLQRHRKEQEGSGGSCDTDPGRLRQTELAVGELRKGSAINFLAFVRGMAMFGKRRVLKSVQEDLLRAHLPSVIKFLGAFDKSGNYALRSAMESGQVIAAVLNALQQNQKLRDLRHVTVVPESDVRSALVQLSKDLTIEYGGNFNQDSFGLLIDGHTWRAGLTFLPESSSIPFIKREERKDEGERRISLGEPTQALDKALSTYSSHSLATTSRTGKTIWGVLQKF
jgi:hypothetical protein